MSFSVFAAEERVNAAAKFESLRPLPDSGAFVIRSVDGKTVCNDATRSEALLINRARSAETRVFGERTGRIQSTGSAGLNIVLRGTAQLDANPAAKAAFERAAEIWESKIANPITVYVDVDFGSTFFGTPFDEDVIAAAQSDVRYLDADLYADIRTLLNARADNANETAVYAALPALNIPTDLGPTTGTSSASMLFRAIGAMPAIADPNDENFPKIGFNNEFPYDFDPSNGISPGQTDFEGVVVHEIGHMLGFVSAVGYQELGSPLPLSIFDYFRFRPGVTLGNFGTAQRIQSSGGTHVYFTGNTTVALSTGRPNGEGGDENQASHWKDDAITSFRIGVMDPTLSKGVRSQMTDADLQAFGMMGYNIVSGETPGGQAPAAPTNLTATGTSTSNIRLNWTDNSNNETEFRIEQKTGPTTFLDIGSASANATQITVAGFSAGESATFRVRARNVVGDSAYSNEATGTTNSNPGSCTPSDTVVCLLSDRFRVKIDYVNPFSNPPNQPGTFRAARLLSGTQNPDTALFGFSSAQAVEVVVRIQDTRPFAPRFDIYYGGMTDVGYTVTVTDTQTGTTRQYTNTAGRVGGGVDRTSFPTSALGSPDRQITSGGRDSFPAEMTGYKMPVRMRAAGAAAPFTQKNRIAAHGAGTCSEVEPNETIPLADELTLGQPCTGVANETDAHEYYIEYEGGEIGYVQDVFKFTTGASGAISVNLTFTYAPADLDVVLFKQVGAELVIIDVEAGITTTEIINANEPAGTYYVGISAYDNGSPYTITVNGPGAGPVAPSNLIATGTSTSVIRLTWNDNSNDETAFVVEQKVGANFIPFNPPLGANVTSVNITQFQPNTSATFRVKARNASGDSAYSNEATGTTQGEIGPCTPSSTVVCLLSDRFRVKIDYVNPFSNPPNQPGTFLAARLLSGVQNPDTALFGFASAQAVEVVVRIQDTRPFAPRFDVYYGGMTDVGYTVTVTDTQTGTTRQYTNTVGTVGGGVDRTSFPAN